MSTRCILGCPPKTRAKLAHRFPNPIKYPIQHEAWLKDVSEDKKENFDYRKYRICDKHFQKKDKYFNGLLNRIIGIPTLCLPGQPSTHINCDCDWKFAGRDSPSNTKNVQVIRNTVEDEHDYTTQITVQRKYTSLLEKEHDYHSKPQEEDKTIDYVHESGNATSTCIKLLDRYDNFGKIAANGLTPTEIEESTNVNHTLEEILNNVSNKPKPVLSDADVVKVETEQTKTLNQTKQNRKTKNANPIRNANISKLLNENTETSTILKICIPDTNSNELCISDNDFPNNAIGRRTLVPQPVLSNADIADLENENTSIAKANTNTLSPVRIRNGENSISGSRPGCPKRAKLDISELDEYKIVGSTTIVTGLFAPDEIQPSEDPLAIHSPDIGVNESVGLNEDSMGSVRDSMGTVEDSMGNVEDSMGSVGDSMGTVEDSMGTVEDNMSCVEDTSVDKDSRHPVDSIEFNKKDTMAHFEDKAEYELDTSINDKDKLAITFALKFIFKQGKTAKQAFEEIVSTYGPGKISLKEAECWYREFELGNNVIRIISSGGPVYK